VTPSSSSRRETPRLTEETGRPRAWAAAEKLPFSTTWTKVAARFRSIGRSIFAVEANESSSDDH
jgi:hypothetical protein